MKLSGTDVPVVKSLKSEIKLPSTTLTNASATPEPQAEMMAINSRMYRVVEPYVKMR